MTLIQTIVIALLTLGILVAFHEFGHFWVARRCGVKVLRFSIGFGKAIWQTTDRYGTEFAAFLLAFGARKRLQLSIRLEANRHRQRGSPGQLSARDPCFLGSFFAGREWLGAGN